MEQNPQRRKIQVRQGTTERQKGRKLRPKRAYGFDFLKQVEKYRRQAQRLFLTRKQILRDGSHNTRQQEKEILQLSEGKHHTAIKQTLRMGKVFASINEVFIDEAFTQLQDDMESFKSTLPISVRSKISPDLQKILDVATELPDKRSRAETCLLYTSPSPRDRS